MSAPQYVYVMKDLQKVFPGGREIMKNVWLSFLPGAKIGIIGINGSGKTTLLRIMAGIDKEFNGEAWAAKGMRVGYLSQEPELDPAKDVKGNIMDGLAETQAILDKFNAVSARFAEELSDDEMTALLDEQAALQEQIDAVDGWEIERTAEIARDALRCPPGDSDISKLSGGEKRRVALCRLLLQHPDILLLDEPTNHLDAESIAWLERHLQEYTGTVVLVTHDRYFLDNITQWILEIDRGECIPYEGNYSAWIEAKQKRLSVENQQQAAQKKALDRELDWIRQSPKGRQTKSKARVSAYDTLLAESKNISTKEAQIVIPAGPRLGSMVIEAKNISKGFDGTSLINDLSFRLPPGGIVGVIGPNGAGKTTLFKMITDQEKPDGGSFDVGDTVQLGYVDQSRDTLSADKSIWEELSNGLDEIELGKQSVSSRAYCSWFNFRGPDQQKKVGSLSGGERNRVHLAKILKSGANLLLFDEPTNDLDVETLRALEEALLKFAGCAVVISHDRFFLDRVATHILAFEGDGHVEWFEGNFASYEEDKKRRLGITDEDLRQGKYKRLKRA
ncbi:MAG: energy-dependent translational throttle protein EttA [Alphaproteobacteria bacterium]|jgi:energy-dependent translational throttle protein EttA|nr:energy-dependent translational throttle protein EttA [Alphaproteobacteria bacterium]MBT5390573.1 energy-dependent translational throttle protein EttA [Alphaproteobacteria bacterium]MBT5540932.1 energy-dependent translational throttle protein EttA [Alphaproteobacteria bacterium]MBT5654587.1 energy-dependent translational throttle protein EttA [Alphaproteobacteria bacterium]